MSNQLTPMQELISELRILIQLHPEDNIILSSVRRKATELLQKEQQVHEEIWDDGNDNITYDELYGYDRLLFFKDYYNTKFKQNEK